MLPSKICQYNATCVFIESNLSPKDCLELNQGKCSGTILKLYFPQSQESIFTGMDETTYKVF